jgi:hypothetical protein
MSIELRATAHYSRALMVSANQNLVGSGFAISQVIFVFGSSYLSIG